MNPFRSRFISNNTYLEYSEWTRGTVLRRLSKVRHKSKDKIGIMTSFSTRYDHTKCDPRDRIFKINL